MTKSKNLELANQKYFSYLVDSIVNKTYIHMMHDLDDVETSRGLNTTIWFRFSFDNNGSDQTSYRANTSDNCTLFNIIKVTRRIINFLTTYGLTSEEIAEVIELLKLRWSEDFGICFSKTHYDLLYEHTQKNVLWED